MQKPSLIFLFILIISLNCCTTIAHVEKKNIKTGAEQTEKYLPLIKNKSVALVANHTSLIKNTHLLDSLLALGVNIQKVFSPEHGFRGKADAGELIHNFTDEKTGVQVVSLYGNNKKPQAEDLQDVDLVIFDLQDVGVRFYTYISTMHYVMEACAENNIELLIFDRPNPNGFYIDGPVLEENHKSFVGMHTVPIVHGMTIAEYARMINGERWLANGIQCTLSFILCDNYTHDSLYRLPVAPSPNLPNMQAVYLYPSLGFFEGTKLNVGRGTDFPFQVFGSPDFIDTSFSYTPRRIDGASKFPPHEDQQCFGVDLRNYPTEVLIKSKQINIDWLLKSYHQTADTTDFFNLYFYNISGTKTLKEQIISDKTEAEIRQSWQAGLEKFKNIRSKYLLYDDFKTK
ncbi:MAG: exo-beta-N-acetylmuramidase NamZ domain-containing protein [Bacteroidales bacterium]